LNDSRSFAKNIGNSVKNKNASGNSSTNGKRELEDGCLNFKCIGGFNKVGGFYEELEGIPEELKRLNRWRRQKCAKRT
jgi:hypothetical protein